MMISGPGLFHLRHDFFHRLYRIADDVVPDIGNGRRLLRSQTGKPDLDAVHLFDDKRFGPFRFRERLPVLVRDIGRDPGEGACRHQFFQLLRPHVEIVVAKGLDIDFHRIEHVDHMLSLEYSGQERCRRVVAIGDRQRMGMLHADLLDEAKVVGDVFGVSLCVKIAVEVGIVNDRYGRVGQGMPAHLVVLADKIQLTHRSGSRVGRRLACNRSDHQQARSQ